VFVQGCGWRLGHRALIRGHSRPFEPWRPLRVLLLATGPAACNQRNNSQLLPSYGGSVPSVACMSAHQCSQSDHMPLSLIDGSCVLTANGLNKLLKLTYHGVASVRRCQSANDGS
jgi:hypothetical protein